MLVQPHSDHSPVCPSDTCLRTRSVTFSRVCHAGAAAGGKRERVEFWGAAVFPYGTICKPGAARLGFSCQKQRGVSAASLGRLLLQPLPVPLRTLGLIHRLGFLPSFLLITSWWFHHQPRNAPWGYLSVSERRTLSLLGEGK